MSLEKENTSPAPEESLEKQNIESPQEGKRDIYNDNIYDINNLEQLPSNPEFDILSKNRKAVCFEMGNDFWKMQRNGQLYQYPDFVSLRNQKNGKLVFDKNLPIYEQPSLYGTAVDKVLKSFDLNALPDFKLKDRSNFIKNSAPSIKLNDYFDKKIGLQRKQLADKAVSDTLKNYESQELKPAIDLLKAMLSVLSIFLIFSKRNKINKEKRKLTKKIIKALENKDLKASDILENQELMNQIPELKNVITRYQDKILRGNLEKKVESLFDDVAVIDTGEKLSTSPEFQKMLGEYTFNQIDKEVKANVGDLTNDMTEYGLSPTEITNTIGRNLSYFQQQHPNLNAEQLHLGGTYLSSLIDPDEKEILGGFSELDKLDSSMIKEIGNFIENFVNKFLKNQKMEQEQELERPKEYIKQYSYNPPTPKLRMRM